MLSICSHLLCILLGILLDLGLLQLQLSLIQLQFGLVSLHFCLLSLSGLLQLGLIKLRPLLQCLTLQLCIHLSYLHATVRWHRWLGLELLSNLVNLGELLGKATKLLLNDLLHLQNYTNLLICVFFNQVFLLSNIHRLVSLGQIVVQQVITQMSGHWENVGFDNSRVLAKQRRLQKRQVRFEVGNVVLLR